jgi:hypothetical protein
VAFIRWPGCSKKLDLAEIMKTHVTLGHSIVRGAEFEE